MIDEKKLTEVMLKAREREFGTPLAMIDWFIEIINSQPKVEKCGDCSRRKFYQLGYNDGYNANKRIPCSEKLPSES